MLGWAVTFLIIALIAAIFGFGGIAAASAGIAKFLFFLFLVMCIIFFLFGWRGRGVPEERMAQPAVRSSSQQDELAGSQDNASVR